MRHDEAIQTRAGARDAAFRLLNRLTAASVVAGIAGLGVFGYASAATYAGTAATTGTTTSVSSTTTASPSGLQSSSGSVSSSSGTGIAVSGGS